MRSISTVPQPGQRATAFLIALALQISFLLLLIQAIEKTRPLLPKPVAREFTLILPRLPTRPARVPAVSGIPSTIRPQITPPFVIAPARQVLPIVPPSSLQGFGQALNDCAPENYANLPEDQKALCARPGEGVAVQQAPNLMGTPSHVKDEARWANVLAHEQSPPRLPCSGAVHNEANLPGGGETLRTGVGFDTWSINFACLAEAFADGSLGDPMTWSTYQVKQWQPEDFYKIEQTYDDWHAAHSKAPVH